MTKFQVITPEELSERDNKPKGRSGRRRSPERIRTIEEYKAELSNIQPGFGVDVALHEGEEKRTVRQNLKLAAQELGLVFDFRPIRDKNKIHFRVMTPEEAQKRPKRRGRPRKSKD